MTDPQEHDPLRTAWGRRIAAERVAQDITQVDLAAATRRSPQTISRIERGEGHLLDTYLAVAQYLGLDLAPLEPA